MQRHFEGRLHGSKRGSRKLRCEHYRRGRSTSKRRVNWQTGSLSPGHSATHHASVRAENVPCFYDWRRNFYMFLFLAFSGVYCTTTILLCFLFFSRSSLRYGTVTPAFVFVPRAHSAGSPLMLCVLSVYRYGKRDADGENDRQMFWRRDSKSRNENEEIVKCMCVIGVRGYT
jgi:hypothetical protein